jgi:hypothetical protein
MKTKSPRGSAMIVSLMVVLGMLIMASGILLFSYHATSSGSAMRRHQQLTNCALSVRQYIASQLRFPNATSISNLNFTIPGSSGNIVLEGGHYNNPQPTITGFKINAGTSSGIAASVEELRNNQSANPGGSSFAGAATCTDDLGHQYEVEFSFAFGV